MDRLIIGVSACLLGVKVRYNGEDRREPFMSERLGEYAQLLPICPEVESGLSVPREPMILVGRPEGPRIVTRDSRVDYTDLISAWVRGKVSELKKKGIHGFVFKSGSPTCGLRQVPVVLEGGVVGEGMGLFAKALKEELPLLPCEEERDVQSAHRLNNFIQRAYAYAYKLKKSAIP
jgi:uncharacterized protein YbbK (DUF523 family)